jgi:hypothetical protein
MIDFAVSMILLLRDDRVFLRNFLQAFSRSQLILQFVFWKEGSLLLGEYESSVNRWTSGHLREAF